MRGVHGASYRLGPSRLHGGVREGREPVRGLSRRHRSRRLSSDRVNRSKQVRMNGFLASTPYPVRLLMVAIPLLLFTAVTSIPNVRDDALFKGKVGWATMTPEEVEIDRCKNRHWNLTYDLMLSGGDTSKLVGDYGTLSMTYQTVTMLYRNWVSYRTLWGEERADESTKAWIKDYCDSASAPATTTPFVPVTAPTTVLRTTVPPTTVRPAAPLRDCMNASTGKITPTRGECPAGFYEPDETTTCVPTSGHGKEIEVDFGKPCPKGYEVLGDY